MFLCTEMLNNVNPFSQLVFIVRRLHEIFPSRRLKKPTENLPNSKTNERIRVTDEILSLDI